MNKWYAAFQIAAVYVGTIVGAGFATGKEIVEFFSRFGFFGLIGILMSAYLFIFMGTKLMLLAAHIKAESYQQFNEYLFGRTFGPIVNIIMLIMLLGVCSVMLSGAGAVFEEQLGLNRSFGIFLTIGLALVIMIIGTKGLVAVNSFVVPTMVVFSLMLMVLSLKQPNYIDRILFIPFVEDGWNAVVAPFAYTAFNLSLAQAVLVPIATEVKNKDAIRLGGMLGGCLLTIILFSSHFTLISLIDVTSYEIPMAVIMKKLASNFYWLFIFVIYGEIFTSVIGNVFGIERQLKKKIKLPSIIIVLIIFLVTYLISIIKYSTLLSYLYPLFGYISIIFLVLLWMKRDKK